MESNTQYTSTNTWISPNYMPRRGYLKGICPGCGRCRNCGGYRPNSPYIYPINPNPYYPYGYPYQFGTAI